MIDKTGKQIAIVASLIVGGAVIFSFGMSTRSPAAADTATVSQQACIDDLITTSGALLGTSRDVIQIASNVMQDPYNGPMISRANIRMNGYVDIVTVQVDGYNDAVARCGR